MTEKRGMVPRRKFNLNGVVLVQDEEEFSSIYNRSMEGVVKGIGVKLRSFGAGGRGYEANGHSKVIRPGYETFYVPHFDSAKYAIFLVDGERAQKDEAYRKRFEKNLERVDCKRASIVVKKPGESFEDCLDVLNFKLFFDSLDSYLG